MRKWVLISLLLISAAHRLDATESVWSWFNPKLRHLEQKRSALLRELEALGTPLTGQTSAEMGYQSARTASPPPTSAWIQLDLQAQIPIDSVALVPALVSWQSVDRLAFAFPLRFRVDLSNDARFETFVTIGVFTEEDFPNPGLAPVMIKAGGKIARYVRLTVTKLAHEDQQYFFALSELMVLSGNLNVAIDSPVTGSASMNIPPRWSAKNLVDGRTPLGPPIKRELLPWDGLYAGAISNATPWIQLDLGGIFPIQQVRLHPIHARFGADIPGYAFPKSILVEASREPDFIDSIALLNSTNFPGPGNNPVTLWASNDEVRYVRVTATESTQMEDRFGLAEIEVYSNGTNVAPGSIVTRLDDPRHSGTWPLSVVADGFASYGRLMELPEWLRDWERRRELQMNLKRLAEQEIALTRDAHRRALWIGSVVGIAGILSIFSIVFLVQFRRKRELRDLRLRFARDIHDDIGSNLAGIAVLSEVAGGGQSLNATQREDWREVNRISQETMSAIREVLWLTGGREEAGLDFMARLQTTAARMLSGREVHWIKTTNELPVDWPLEAKRQVFLFFKEALANVIRHSSATRVSLSAQVLQNRFQLCVADNGPGFDPEKVSGGIGLNSQQMRARALGGSVNIESAPDKGTVICLDVPLKSRRYFTWRTKSQT